MRRGGAWFGVLVALLAAFAIWLLGPDSGAPTDGPPPADAPSAPTSEPGDIELTPSLPTPKEPSLEEPSIEPGPDGETTVPADTDPASGLIGRGT